MSDERIELSDLPLATSTPKRRRDFSESMDVASPDGLERYQTQYRQRLLEPYSSPENMTLPQLLAYFDRHQSLPPRVSQPSMEDMLSSFQTPPRLATQSSGLDSPAGPQMMMIDSSQEPAAFRTPAMPATQASISYAEHFQVPSSESFDELLSTLDTPEILKQARSFESSHASIPDTPEDVTEAEPLEVDRLSSKFHTPDVLSSPVPDNGVISDTEDSSLNGLEQSLHDNLSIHEAEDMFLFNDDVEQVCRSESNHSCGASHSTQMDFDLAMDIDVNETMPVTPPPMNLSGKYPGPWVEDVDEDGMDVSPSKRVRESDGEEEQPPPRRHKRGRSPAASAPDSSRESQAEGAASPISDLYVLSEHGSDVPGSPLRHLPDEEIAIPYMSFPEKEAMLRRLMPFA
jgi:hypothetical protein